MVAWHYYDTPSTLSEESLELQSSLNRLKKFYLTYNLKTFKQLNPVGNITFLEAPKVIACRIVGNKKLITEYVLMLLKHWIDQPNISCSHLSWNCTANFLQLIFK